MAGRPRRARNAGGELAEAAFQAQVEGLARFYGWRLYHTHDSRRSAAGFPDLVLVRPPELLFVELKTDTGRVRPEQEEWLADLRAVGDAVALMDLSEIRAPWPPPDDYHRPAVEAHLWRPRDWEALQARLARDRVLQAIPPPA